MIVAALGPEVARPFVYAACHRYGVSFDPQSGDDMLWWGLLSRSVVAVVGWAPIDDEGREVALFGPFGSGAANEDALMFDLLHAHEGIDVSFISIPASPSVYIRRQCAQLERYGTCRTPQWGT